MKTVKAAFKKWFSIASRFGHNRHKFTIVGDCSTNGRLVYLLAAQQSHTHTHSHDTKPASKLRFPFATNGAFSSDITTTNRR